MVNSLCEAYSVGKSSVYNILKQKEKLQLFVDKIYLIVNMLYKFNFIKLNMTAFESLNMLFFFKAWIAYIR